MSQWISRRYVVGAISSLFATTGCLGAGEKTPHGPATERTIDNSMNRTSKPTSARSSPTENRLTERGDLVNGFRPGTFESVISLPFRLFVPESYRSGERTAEPYPIVLALHGAAARGSDNRAQLRFNSTFYGSDRVQSIEECFVLSPQCPKDSKWVDIDGFGVGSTQMREVTPPMSSAIALLDAVIERFQIDPERQYVVGLSMGGYGTWDAICRYPNRFAAATPMAGGGHPGRAHLMDDVRVWAFHGDADSVVPVEGSREMISAMREADLDPKYTEFADTGHAGAAKKALAMDELPRWTFGHDDTIQ